jgi:hypothetical protein
MEMPLANNLAAPELVRVSDKLEVRWLYRVHKKFGR